MLQSFVNRFENTEQQVTSSQVDSILSNVPRIVRDCLNSIGLALA